MRKFLVVLCLCVQSLVQAADKPAPMNMDPIHEAFVTQNSDPTALDVVTRQPPALLAETQPPQPNPKTIWIPGYWKWVREKKDFVWICGVWRLPPPDHIWSTGSWKEEKGGWIWIRGIWMPDPSKGPWTYAKAPPPASQNENTGNSPGPDYFWFAGYWNYDAARGSYDWLSGSWQKFDPNMVLEAAQWAWRPEGYLFVPSYWDWALDSRGVAYDCKSQKPLEPQALAKQMMSCYPNYAAECCHSYHFHPDYWAGCDCIPAWWGWSDWWALPWGDQWWLWWWWINVDYPYPPFLPPVIIDLIPPPIVIIDVFPPIFITPFGIPSLIDWIDAINQALGGDNTLTPFLPSDAIDKIIDRIKDKIPKTGTKKPGGKPNGQHPPKPNSSKPLTPPSGTAQAPSHPQTTQPSTTTTHTAPVPTSPGLTPPAMNLPQQPIPQSAPPEYYPPQQQGGGYYGSYNGGYYGGQYGGYYGGHHGGGYDGGGYYGGHHGGYYGGHHGGSYGGHHGGSYGGRHGGDGGGHHGGRHGGDGGGHHGGHHHASAQDTQDSSADKKMVTDSYNTDQ